MMKRSVDIRSFFSESARSKRVELEINESESETEGESVDCHVMDSTSVSEVESTTDVSVPSTSISSTPVVYDIGNIIAVDKPVNQICRTLNSLSNFEKYSYMFNHAKPPHVLPSKFFHGCNRKFNVEWLNKYSWLKYSTVLDGVFCAPCAILLHNRENKGALVNQSFSNWTRLGEKLNNHSSLAYHREALLLADSLKTSVENPSSRIDVMMNSVIQSHMEENKQILLQIVRAILYLGKQGLLFRGTTESVETSKNPGNFLALLKLFAEKDEILHSHLHRPRLRNATYISPTTQNEVINIIGHDVIRGRIIADVNNARYFSVLADATMWSICHCAFVLWIVKVIFMKNSLPSSNLNELEQRISLLPLLALLKGLVLALIIFEGRAMTVLQQ